MPRHEPGKPQRNRQITRMHHVAHVMPAAKCKRHQRLKRVGTQKKDWFWCSRTMSHNQSQRELTQEPETSAKNKAPVTNGEIVESRRQLIAAGQNRDQLLI